eukprot:6060419-Pyramimonas_sp.AAC.1
MHNRVDGQKSPPGTTLGGQPIISPWNHWARKRGRVGHASTPQAFAADEIYTSPTPLLQIRH